MAQRPRVVIHRCSGFLCKHTRPCSGVGQHNATQRNTAQCNTLQAADLIQRVLILCIPCRPESVWWTLYH